MRRFHLAILAHVAASYVSFGTMVIVEMGVDAAWVDLRHSPHFTMQLVLAPATQLIYLPLLFVALQGSPRWAYAYPLLLHGFSAAVVWFCVSRWSQSARKSAATVRPL